MCPDPEAGEIKTMVGEVEDLLWFKKSIFYETYVKSFYDSNGDGIGDFGGLSEKIEYFNFLGVDCIWLLPFYKSPMRDGGYDVADYCSVDPAYGTMEDFQEFLDKAHSHGLKVIIDLVLNHVSDQHEWFKEARSSRDSPKRDWFVWSDTNEKYKNARVIFIDTEKSNWAWDENTQQYYWHRFYDHQPDLNYENPEVREAIKDVIRFWARLGIDGFRCDAVPYLFEDEETNCENLPQTHSYFKEVRKMLEDEFPGKILLAEANQWPTEAAQYFGEGDEFHMAFNFPLMPRIFIALAKEDSLPIVNIIPQTMNIPDNCSWGVFLRNHDELTLEMVTDEERDLMYNEYANVPRMRLNLGIRRRLATLIEQDRATIELLHSLILSMPGTPILYYGDEILMGDNIELGDRDGVRTPMQWTPGINAGFSSSEPEKLYSPILTVPPYSYLVENVETQSLLNTSFLNWLRKLLRIRKNFADLIGRGRILFPKNDNRKVLVYLRSLEDQHMLVLLNLSREPSAVNVELPDFVGYVPHEVRSSTSFPEIKDGTYMFTMGPRSFFWLHLQKEVPET